MSRKQFELTSHSAPPVCCCCWWFCFVLDATRNGFRHILERDAVGWSPLHYAALGNNAELVQSLLAKRANVHCRSTTLGKKTIGTKILERENRWLVSKCVCVFFNPNILIVSNDLGECLLTWMIVTNLCASVIPIRLRYL